LLVVSETGKVLKRYTPQGRTLSGAAYPVADIILRRGSPMAFVSGYDRSHIPERYKNVPLIQKPVDATEVARALSA
jgi:hypothetical protein